MCQILMALRTLLGVNLGETSGLARPMYQMETPRIRLLIGFLRRQTPEALGTADRAAVGMTQQNGLAPKAPSSTRHVYIDRNVTSPIVVSGPSNSSSVAALTVGGRPGDKTLDLGGTGSLSVIGDAVADTNGWIVVQRGAFLAGRIVVRNPSAPPGPATSWRGTFYWTDLNELGSSSVNVDTIRVQYGGDFVNDWLNPSTGTLSANQMDVDFGGRAFFEWNATGIQTINNSGVVSLEAVSQPPEQ